MADVLCRQERPFRLADLREAPDRFAVAQRAQADERFHLPQGLEPSLQPLSIPAAPGLDAGHAVEIVEEQAVVQHECHKIIPGGSAFAEGFQLFHRISRPLERLAQLHQFGALEFHGLHRFCQPAVRRHPLLEPVDRADLLFVPMIGQQGKKQLQAAQQRSGSRRPGHAKQRQRHSGQRHSRQGPAQQAQPCLLPSRLPDSLQKAFQRLGGRLSFFLLFRPGRRLEPEEELPLPGQFPHGLLPLS